MPQAAFTESTPKLTHLIIGSPMSTGRTLCGLQAVAFGDNLGVTAASWPKQSAPWCEECVRAYGE
jgi:hypothetical protein